MLITVSDVHNWCQKNSTKCEHDGMLNAEVTRCPCLKIKLLNNIILRKHSKFVYIDNLLIWLLIMTDYCSFPPLIKSGSFKYHNKKFSIQWLRLKNYAFMALLIAQEPLQLGEAALTILKHWLQTFPIITLFRETCFYILMRSICWNIHSIFTLVFIIK